MHMSLLTIFGLFMILTFDLLTTKLNQFISVPQCTRTVNTVKFPQALIKYQVHKLSGCKARQPKTNMF